MAGDFVDSNVLIYAFTADPRAIAAQTLLAERPCTTSVQGLNGFANVARRKLGKSWGEVRDALARIRVCTSILAVDLDTHADGLRIAEQYRISFFDALMVAAALKSGSDTLWSEDMQHGMVVDGRLRIANPFRISP